MGDGGGQGGFDCRLGLIGSRFPWAVGVVPCYIRITFVLSIRYYRAGGMLRTWATLDPGFNSLRVDLLVAGVYFGLVYEDICKYLSSSHGEILATFYL